MILRVLKMAENDNFKPLQPGIAMQITSLLEDAGLVRIANGGWTFEQAMNQTAFILPDEVIWMIVFASLGISAHAWGWI